MSLAMAASSQLSYTVRRATRDEVSIIKRMTDDEGWEYDIDYLHCMYDMDDTAWFLALTQDGKVVGVRALAYYPDHKLVTGGIYIVNKEFRGRGVGRDVNAAALESVGGSNVVISANDVKLYDTRGFTYDYDVHLIRVRCRELVASVPDHSASHLTIKPFSKEIFDDLVNYDLNICKHQRLWFLRKWIIQSSESVQVIFYNNQIVGYGSLRDTEFGYQIAPLYADSESIAWMLMNHLLKAVPDIKSVDLFVSGVNAPMMKLVKSMSHDAVVVLHKMYTKQRVDIPLDNVYSLSAMAMSLI